MGTLKRIQDYILPHEIDFFQRLQDQSMLTSQIIAELYNLYVLKRNADYAVLKNMIRDAEEVRKKNLTELYSIFITPVDKEAISRAYFNLDWVVMSIEHMQVELEVFKINDLSEYQMILELLKEEMSQIHSGFGKLDEKDYEHFSKCVNNIVACDNQIIEEYAKQVSALLDNSDFKRIIMIKETLMQLKEISKRIRTCANDLEDMLFKM